jgi:septal ring-binding cell division protein DamX
MNQQNPTLRFDHREIAVIFSLFVFVSLLMFTVGILVGKGLAQARYENTLSVMRSPASSTTPKDSEQRLANEETGTSVTTDNPTNNPQPLETVTAVDDAPAPETQADKKDEPLQLIPQKSQDGDVLADSAAPSSKSPEIENLMKDSRIKSLIDGSEDDEIATNRAIASASTRKPQSIPKGAYTVQVGSYTSEKEATDRVQALKKLGFPYAYFSVKRLDDQKTKWYRVWLGYYPDFKSAKQNGELLEQRGEVKNYLVRKSDAPG